MRFLGLHRLWPRSLRGQLALLLGGSSIVMLGMAAAAFLTVRGEDPTPPPGPWPDAIGIATIFRAISATPAADRPALARSLSTPDLGVVLNTNTPCLPGPDGLATRTLRRALYAVNIPDTPVPLVMNCASDIWPRGVTHVSFDHPRATFLVRNYARARGTGMILATLPLALWVATIAMGAAVLLLWVAWYIRRPLGLLTTAVARYETQDASLPLDEAGPSEIRDVIRAFNALRARLARSTETRVSALMGVAHDLRTPLTRLALRIEMGDEYMSRDGVQRDVDLMKRMLDNAMSLFQGYDETEDWHVVDLAALIQDLCSDFSAVGRSVHDRTEHPVLLRCQPLAMTRAFGNLVENGCRYANNVFISIRDTEGEVVVDVIDDGPGMSARQQRMVFQRDTSTVRDDGDGHLGLGLPIVAEIVRRHSGRIALLDAEPCGLLVRVALPRGAPCDETPHGNTEHREKTKEQCSGNEVTL